MHSARLTLSTEGDCDVVDITEGVARAVAQSGVESGVACVSVPGSTAAITTIEHERGAVHDLRETLDRLVPPAGDYLHNRLNADSNAHAHVRAAIVGPSESIPIAAGGLALGTWQQLVLVDFDDRPRERTVVVAIVS